MVEQASRLPNVTIVLRNSEIEESTAGVIATLGKDGIVSVGYDGDSKLMLVGLAHSIIRAVNDPDLLKEGE